MKKSNVRITRGSGNVFLDLGFPPHEAAVMLLRCELATRNEFLVLHIRLFGALL